MFPLQICQQTGWGGQPILTHRNGDGDTAARVTPVTDSRRLRITFNGSVSDVLPWKFTPQQREVAGPAGRDGTGILHRDQQKQL